MGKRGDANPRADKLPLLAQALGCSIDALFSRRFGAGAGGTEKEGRRRAVPEGAYGAQGAFSPGEDRGGGRALRRQAGDAVRRTFSKERS